MVAIACLHVSKIAAGVGCWHIVDVPVVFDDGLSPFVHATAKCVNPCCCMVKCLDRDASDECLNFIGSVIVKAPQVRFIDRTDDDHQWCSYISHVPNCSVTDCDGTSERAIIEWKHTARVTQNWRLS